MMEREGRGARTSCSSGGCRCRVRAGCCRTRAGRCRAHCHRAHCHVLAGCRHARAGRHCARCRVHAVVVALALVVVVPVVVFVPVVVALALVVVVLVLVVVVAIAGGRCCCGYAGHCGYVASGCGGCGSGAGVVVVVLVVMVVVVVVVICRVVGGCRRCRGGDVAHRWHVHVVAESGCVAWGAYTLLSPRRALTTCGSSGEWRGWAWWLVIVGGESVVAVFGNVYESSCQTNKQ